MTPDDIKRLIGVDVEAGEWASPEAQKSLQNVVSFLQSIKRIKQPDIRANLFDLIMSGEYCHECGYAHPDHKNNRFCQCWNDE